MLPAHAYHTFFVVMGIMAAAYLVRAFFYYIIAYYGHTFGIRVEADIRRDLFRHMQSLGYEFYDHNRTGQLMSRLTTDLFEITELAHHGPEDLMISLLTIVARSPSCSRSSGGWPWSCASSCRSCLSSSSRAAGK